MATEVKAVPDEQLAATLLHNLDRVSVKMAKEQNMSLSPEKDDAVPYIIESDRSPAACRKSWARLIQEIYEVDPLICPKCRGTMRIISSIEDRDVIKIHSEASWPLAHPIKTSRKGPCATCP